MLTVRRIFPKSPRCGSQVMRSAKRRCTCRHSSRCIQASIAERTSRWVPGTVLVAVANPAPAICAMSPRSSGTLIRVRSSARAWLMVAGLSPTSFPMSRSWLSLIRSEDSAIAPAPCSSAARASTRSSACLSRSDCRAGAGAGSGDFSSAMQNYIGLNPPEYDLELTDESITDGLCHPEYAVERGLHVSAGRAIHGPQIVAHVAIENLRRRPLQQKRASTNRRGALVTLANTGAPLLGRDVVGDR